MADVFESAADRIAFSEAVDFIDQGRAQLVPAPLAEDAVRRGLLVREGNALTVTEKGREQHKIALRERFSDG
jgi:hypothetical protein